MASRPARRTRSKDSGRDVRSTSLRLRDVRRWRHPLLRLVTRSLSPQPPRRGTPPQRMLPGRRAPDRGSIRRLRAIGALTQDGTPPTGSKPVAGPAYDADLIVGRVETHLDEHLADPSLGLDALADAANVSPSSVGRAFRKVYDTSPWRYVMRQRVEHAARLLNDPSRALAAIALDAGFYDQAHLTRTFKRFMGETPGEYRDRQHPSGDSSEASGGPAGGDSVRGDSVDSASRGNAGDA